MNSHSENRREPQSEPVAAGLAPPPELETDEVPESLVSEFSSLTTPYCWVTEALTAGRFFRLVDAKGRELAVGRLYDPSGRNELAPLEDFGLPDLGAVHIQFRAEGDWQPA
jgi:hypothetical protein